MSLQSPWGMPSIAFPIIRHHKLSKKKNIIASNESPQTAKRTGLRPYYINRPVARAENAANGTFMFPNIALYKSGFAAYSGKCLYKNKYSL